MRQVFGLELAVLMLCFGCENRPSHDGQQPAPRPRSSASELRLVPALRSAPPFRCGASLCAQSHPRLPDSGEWRCAESERVVWCAGGEPAAGVVPGPLDPGYRCGQRFGAGHDERVCIDEAPDYPPPHAARERCYFSQERGIERLCKPGAASDPRPLSPGALPACWLGKDCRSGQCDRGTCRCTSDADCERGTCQLGVCAERSP